MKRYPGALIYSCAFLVFGIASVSAQTRDASASSLGRFVIGAGSVAPSTDFPVPNIPANGGRWLQWSSGAQTAPGYCAPGDIPLERWQQLRDLGIDLAGVTLGFDALFSDGTHRIRRMAAAHGISLVLSDRGVGDGAMSYSGMERLMYHVESPRMCDTVGARCIDHEPFHTQPRDVSSYPLTPWNNAVLYPCTAMPRGVLLRRLPASHPEFGMFEGGMRSDGVYYLSLRLQYLHAATPAGDAIPDDTTTIFLLTIEDEDASTAGRFVLRGSDFHSAGGVIDTVHEFLLDIFRAEVEEGSGRVRLREGLRDSVETAVRASGINRGGRIVPDVGARRLPFLLEYMPFDDRRPLIAVDGIGLSCGIAYALFNPSNPAQPSNWHPTPREFLTRFVDTLCTGERAPAPAAVMLEESIGGLGNIASSAFVANLIEERSNGRSIPMRYLPVAMGLSGLELVMHAFRRSLQSLYAYPYTLMGAEGNGRAPLPGDERYYAFHYRAPFQTACMGRRIEHFRRIAEQRRTDGAMGDWIPCVQNYAYGIAGGDATGHPPSDLMWLRDPTTNELRLSANMALAYGAKGIWYYVFGGTPGADTTDPFNVGGRGFLTFDHCKRARNAYGENLWDSMRVFHHDFLRVIGDTLFPLFWDRAWSIERLQLGMPGDELLRRIRTAGEDGFDATEDSYAEAAVFRGSAAADTAMYVLLINKRVRDGEARRIAVTLGGGATRAERWRVIDVLSGDSITAPARDVVDAAAGMESFGAHLAPGMAALLRLEAIAAAPAALPSELVLETAFPQPCDNVVTIPVSTPMAAEHRLTLVDALGRVREIRQVRLDAGRRGIVLETGNLADGVYIIRIEAAGRTAFGKLVVRHARR